MASTSSWKLADLAKPRRGAPRVFSCFAGGGGSCMGYTLAGFRVTGANELDADMAARYRVNLRHRVWEEPIQTFRTRDSLPKAILDLDVLDGSPPCSAFSLAGNRENDWGKERHFREGQAVQVLDDLFGEFLQLVDRARPKVVVGENVRGMIIGKAKGYAKEVMRSFREIGYDPQMYLLNAASMGVPQVRERLFFVARRRDLELPPIQFDFDEPPIAVQDALRDCPPGESEGGMTEWKLRNWNITPQGENFSNNAIQVLRSRITGKHPASFNWYRLHPRGPAYTLVGTPVLLHWSEPRHLTDRETARIQSFPDDYDFGPMKATYVCGMSVPPRMMERVATQIRRQWFDGDKRTKADAA